MPDLERRLRSALRPNEPEEAVGRRLRAAVPGLLPSLTPRRRLARAGRRLLPAVAAVTGLAALVVGLVVLLSATGDGDSGETVAAPPPLRYGILERPPDAREAPPAWPPGPFGEPIDGSVRAASAMGGRALLVARLEGGPICIRRIAPNDAVDEDCAAPSSPALRLVAPWPDSAGGSVDAFGLVPDAVAAVRIGERTVEPRENTWSAAVDPAAGPVTVDFLTADGVVEAWHREVALDPAAVGLLAEEPYLGVTCRIGDPGCDRVGLSVQLREPARAVRAEIDGRGFALDDSRWSGPATPGGLRSTFAGFLDPAGLHAGALAVPEIQSGRWTGSPPVEATVNLQVVASDGSTRRATVETILQPGWG